MGSAPHSRSAGDLRGGLVQGRVRRLVALALAGALASMATAQPPAPARPVMIETPPVDYADPAAWICRPGVDDGTCSTNLDAMIVDAAGQRTPHPYRAAPAPAIDCFYIYPTGSDDPTYYSDLKVDRSETRIVHGQLARLGAQCRLFAPAYHQLTMAALRWAMSGPGAGARVERGFDIPYRDVLAAWRAYLARDNQGRGVVLIGHSQGAMLLKRLIAEEIDGRPAQRRLVGAYLAGNIDLTTATFHAIGPCAARGQTGCLVAWSSYLDGQAGPRIFGGGKGAICVNPAAPGGGRGLLDAYLARPGFAPESDPPYVELKGQLSGECVADGEGAVLRIRIEPGRYHDLLATTLGASRQPGWGLHPLDISLVQGDLVEMIGAQAAGWTKR